ncbi:PiggyBac transposable element-derived protein 4 [Plakobranchus ocellatus]|uniref:PiggyBac transposable element-derived protein 4 n=1 Tax=Plakobranchus ocellatus TaxID=259542 RepID=A0AAV3ZU66_9GAST|nr:PiggyBac transposable element-derived protein 4 [Plakobranchus ocellatus]
MDGESGGSSGRAVGYHPREIDEGQPDSGRDTRKTKHFCLRPSNQKTSAPEESVFPIWKQPLSVVSYQSKKGKNVFLLNAMHSIFGSCETNGKPEIILTYIKSKGSVDTMDQMSYAFTEKTKRWLLVVLFNIIDLSTNAIRVIRQARLSEHKLPHDIISTSFQHCVNKRTGTPAGVKESI